VRFIASGKMELHANIIADEDITDEDIANEDIADEDIARRVVELLRGRRVEEMGVGTVG